MQAVRSKVTSTSFNELSFDVSSVPVSRVVQNAGIRIASPWVREAIMQDGDVRFGPRVAQPLDCFGGCYLDYVANSILEMSEGLTDMNMSGTHASTITELISLGVRHKKECERSLIFCSRSYSRWPHVLTGQSVEQKHYPYIGFVAGQVYVAMWDPCIRIPSNARVLVIEK